MPAKSVRIGRKRHFMAMSTFRASPLTSSVQPSFFNRLSSKAYGAFALLNSIRRRLLGRHPRRSSQAQSLLLQLPIELLLEISNFLPAESSVAFVLTCTSLFGVLFPKGKLHGSQLDQLLQLLERDLCKQLFFCQPCHILHHFSSSWRPGQRGRFDDPCRPKLVIRDGYHLGFNLARLAMNKHLLGGGLNLEQLHCSLPNYFGGWNLSSEARVIQNELYLCVSHKLSLNGTGPENRQKLEHTDHGICNHVTTHQPRTRFNTSRRRRPGLTYHQWLLECGRGLYAVPQRRRVPELVPGQHPENWFALAECRDARRSCPVCLTDYVITTNQMDFSDVSELTTTSEPWEIVITAYHQLGPCRSQFDWKWLTYATPLQDMCMENMDASLIGKRSKDGPYAPGSVQARWDWV